MDLTGLSESTRRRLRALDTEQNRPRVCVRHGQPTPCPQCAVTAGKWSVREGQKGGVSLTLPFPPSANDMRASVNGRLITTKVGRDWYERATAIAKGQYAGPTLSGPVAVTCRIYYGQDRHPGPDGNNLHKAILDALTPPKGKKRHGASIIRDDNRTVIAEDHWYYLDDDGQGERVEVVIERRAGR